jgi:hypothetical protein
MATPGTIAIVYGIEELREVCRATSTWTIIDVIEDTRSIMYTVQGNWFASMWSRLGMPVMPIITYRINDSVGDRYVYLYPVKYEKCRDVWIEFNKEQKSWKDMEDAISNCLIEDMKTLSESFVKEIERIRKERTKKAIEEQEMVENQKKIRWEKIKTAVSYCSSTYHYCQTQDVVFDFPEIENHYRCTYASTFSVAMKTVSCTIELLNTTMLPMQIKEGLILFLDELNRWIKDLPK